MTADTKPLITLNPLPNADGSAEYRCQTSHTTIITSVNGPIEVRAKDELPNDATIEVIVKPGMGVSGIRETHLADHIHKTLKSVILTNHHPRTLFQIVCQVVQSEDTTSMPLLLPPLLNCTILALLAAGVPLKTTYWAVHLVVVDAPKPNTTTSGDVMALDGNDEEEEERVDKIEILKNPGKKAMWSGRASHVFAYSKEENMLFMQSGVCSTNSGGPAADGQGFDIDEWMEVEEIARKICCGEGVEIIRGCLEGRRVL